MERQDILAERISSLPKKNFKLKRARYCGIAKNQFQVSMQALAHNLKRLVVLNIPEIQVVSATG